MLQNDVIKCCKMMSSNVALLHSNNCCVLEPAICEDLDLHVVFFLNILSFDTCPTLIIYFAIENCIEIFKWIKCKFLVYILSKTCIKCIKDFILFRRINTCFP